MRSECGLMRLRFLTLPLPATWAKKEDNAAGEKKEGSNIDLVGYLNNPSDHRRRRMHTGQWGFRWGATSHIWQKYADPRPLADEYLGVNEYTTPRIFFWRLPKVQGGTRGTGHSVPSFKTTVNDQGVS